LSATIHFLNRLRLEDRPGQDPGIAVERATVLVGPALILTSVVLACGLAVAVFSDLPALRLFGWLSAFAMIAALTADLCILRPTAMFLRRIDDLLWKGLSPSADGCHSTLAIWKTAGLLKTPPASYLTQILGLNFSMKSTSPATQITRAASQFQCYGTNANARWQVRQA
jgi:hypothetical protein